MIESAKVRRERDLHVIRPSEVSTLTWADHAKHFQKNGYIVLPSQTDARVVVTVAGRRQEPSQQRPLGVVTIENAIEVIPHRIPPLENGPKLLTLTPDSRARRAAEIRVKRESKILDTTEEGVIFDQSTERMKDAINDRKAAEKAFASDFFRKYPELYHDLDFRTEDVTKVELRLLVA